METHNNLKYSRNEIYAYEIGTNKQNVADRDRETILKNALYASSFTKKYDYNKVKSYYNKTRSYKLTMQEFNISSSSALYYILKKDC